MCNVFMMETVSSERSGEEREEEIEIKKILDVRAIKEMVAITQMKVVATFTAPTQHYPC